MIHSMRTTGLLKLILPELQNTVGVEQNRHHCIYICEECGEFHTVRGSPADAKKVELVPWKVDVTALDHESTIALLLQQHIVKYKDAWRELAKS
jgi:hypothetical protein